jgi:hypothetical protein
MTHTLARIAAMLACAAAMGAAPDAPMAVGCRRTDRPPPRAPGDTVVLPHSEDIRHDPSFLCTLHRGGPTARVVLDADSADNWPETVRIYTPPGSARPAQVLPIDDAAGPPPRGRPFLYGEDLNRDGWMDLKVLTAWGATGNEAFDVFLYDPGRRRFVPDSVLTGEGLVMPIAGRPCVLTHWHMGAGTYSDGEYCWTSRGWLLTRTESEDWHRMAGSDSMVHVRRIGERRGGRLVIVRVDTLRERQR